MVKIRRTRKEIRPRNVAAKALRSSLYRPRVSKNPKAYSRKSSRRAAAELLSSKDEE